VDLYAEEKEQLEKDQILDRVFLALSREQEIPKVCYESPLLIIKSF